jgi:hypothetical protein
MMKKAILTSTSDVWRAIVTNAGLDVEVYDEPLVEELASNLGISPTNFAEALEQNGITIETLIINFIFLIAPYAKMMKDILAFFAQAGARATGDNLSFRFEFDKLSENFDFDLRNFRDWEKSFSQVLTTIKVDEVDELQALQIRHAFIAQGITYRMIGSTWTELLPSESDLVEWLERSTGNTLRILPLPPPPTVANEELRSLLERVWQLLTLVVFSENDAATTLTREDVRTIVRGAYLLHSRDEMLLDRLRDLFRNVKTTDVQTTVLIEQLLEIFNLPVWSRRSEFYSVWVGIHLMKTLGPLVRVHAVNRTIVFSFGGSHLATLRLSNDENLHVWCELRTKGSNLIGKGRKGGIQPDYTVLREPTSDANSAVLVVECKQYLRQNRQNFANALVDYGRTHPQAFILLVNYGPTSRSVLERVTELEPALRSRTEVIGNFRPDSTASLFPFARIVRSIVPSAALAPTPTEDEKTTAGSVWNIERSGQVSLSWQSNVDLDLHCWVSDSDGYREHVHYSHVNALLQGCEAQLNNDVRMGGDAEIITWKNADSVVLEFAVHAYSSNAHFAAVRPRVTIKVGECILVFRPPSEGNGRWWRLVRIDRQSFEVFNSISHDPPIH